MTHPNEELLQQAFAAFQRGDMEALQTRYFADDIRYHVSGRSPVSGDYEGTAQVLGLFGRLFELSGGTLRIELHDVVANDEHGVALFTLHAEREGRQLDDNEVLISHPTPDGKAAEVWTQAGDQYAVDEFWS
ncbi:MAG: nuclear transport factor 2 family protein [Streptosporangiaceae bacterium]